MKTNIKAFCMILCLAILFSILAACGGGSNLEKYDGEEEMRNALQGVWVFYAGNDDSNEAIEEITIVGDQLYHQFLSAGTYMEELNDFPFDIKWYPKSGYFSVEGTKYYVTAGAKTIRDGDILYYRAF